MVLRRPQAVAAAGIFIIVLGTLTYVSSSTYSQPGSSFGSFELSSYFGHTAQCPDPLLPAAPLSRRRHICQPLSTNPELGLTAQVCFAPDVVNQGYFLVGRSSAEECAALEKKTVSLMPDENTRLRMRGPDTFHIAIDGEQRWGTETDPEYLGSCQYKFPFNLAFAGPMNVTIWWEFSGYRAIDESEVMSLQWDLAEYVLEGHSQIIKPPASIAQGCPHVSAIPTIPEWRSARDENYIASVPECSRQEATKGRYLRAHYTEPHTFNGFMFQPDGCKWSDPIRIDAPPEEVQRNWKPHNILFWGDSHVRYAYDIMGYMYSGNWTQYKETPIMKALKKVTTLGPINMTFLWDAVLREMKFDLSCENIKEFDIIVLGSSHHNLVLTDEADHDRQFTVHDFGLLLDGLAKKLSPDACPGQKMPRIVWIGSPSRPVKLALPPKKHPLNHGWKDARVNPRLTQFNHVAWKALQHLPGAARVNLFDLSMGMANHFVDGLHMIMTDVQAAFVQDLHQKLWLTEPAYAHLSS